MTARRRMKLPPGYPADYESSARLSDGRTVKIRPILASDAPELAEAIRSADPETLHNRFLGAPPPLTDAVLRGLTEVDYVNRFALVARSRRKGVAIARYIALPPRDDGTRAAEIAVAVAREWRGVGLATQLVKLLSRRAQECGIDELTALFLTNNRPVAELAHDLHGRVVVTDSMSELSAQLAGTQTEGAG